ncbi:hypothetical protein U2F26_32045 [Micromonospora sp. 4G57]|uniref:Integrase n=1 Tax=Micromonospora sicca TaxID=2202420 RepID=A0ABU5JN58_9ACTN|nr:MULTISPECIES: hypothetical protein [unclassified Micromonospora]MDZ5447289.1 hypothetical protein [Micromonospora sp. 4G57]MDZ5494006.1 hypothetical protein [Micromonospora sp. 4G53]
MVATGTVRGVAWPGGDIWLVSDGQLWRVRGRLGGDGGQEVREIAGHSALDVTMTIYAHTSLEEKYRALARLDERISKESLSSDCRQRGDETDIR